MVSGHSFEDWAGRSQEVRGMKDRLCCEDGLTMFELIWVCMFHRETTQRPPGTRQNTKKLVGRSPYSNTSPISGWIAWWVRVVLRVFFYLGYSVMYMFLPQYRTAYVA